MPTFSSSTAKAAVSKNWVLHESRRGFTHSRTQEFIRRLLFVTRTLPLSFHQVDTALDWLGDVTPPPPGKVPVAGSVEEALRALTDDAESGNKDGVMHNLCLFTVRRKNRERFRADQDNFADGLRTHQVIFLPSTMAGLMTLCTLHLPELVGVPEPGSQGTFGCLNIATSMVKMGGSQNLRDSHCPWQRWFT